MLYHQTTVGNRVYSVRQHFPDRETLFLIEYQPINAKTGKPWQATRLVERIEGDDAKARAMHAWLSAVNAAEKAERDRLAVAARLNARAARR